LHSIRGGLEHGTVLGSRWLDRPKIPVRELDEPRWWHFYVSLGVIGALLMFPVQYFGVVSNRSDHQVLPSVLGAITFGAVLGLAMFAFAAWTRRKTGREKG
jgi:hypothetical protein